MKYLFVKEYKVGNKTNTERLIFSSSKELFNYLQEKGERIFNAGFHSADINLYRVEEQE